MKTMSLDNKTLEVAPNWYYDKKQLRTTPSSTVGISYETESRYRGEGARFIFDIGNKLGLSRDTIATGVVYFHRFYMFHSFKDFPRYVTACCCLYLAGKVEETPKKCRDIIKTARTMLTDVQFAQFGKDPRREVMTLEKILLKTMKFDLDVDHPYTFLLRYAKSLKGSQQRVQNMVQMAWYFINDSLSTTLCLQWEPEIIAIAFMSLACKLSHFSVTDWSGRLPSHTKWWDKFVENISHDILKDINGQLLSLYSKSKQPSPLSLPLGKMLKRPAPDQLVPALGMSSQSGANVQDVKSRPVYKSSTHKSSTHVAAPPAKKARTTSPSNIMGSLNKMTLSENLNIVKPLEPNNILPNVTGSLDKMPLSENLNIVKPPEPNAILPNVVGSLDKMPLSENLNIVKPPEPNNILPNVTESLVKKILSEIANIVKPSKPNTILPNVKGSLDKKPLSENENIVKPPEPNNNLPGFNFLYPSYQQQTAVEYQDPYVSATERAATGNQYLPPNYYTPKQQYQQPDGTYPTPPSVNAATANQVPMRPPPPPMNARVIPNVPHSLEFQQLPAPDAANANSAAPPAKKVRTTPPPPNVVGISDKNPLPGSPNIVKPPEPNNNLPGLPSAPPPGFNFTYSPYQQQTAVGYQAPYVSAPVGATAGNQYPGFSQTGQYRQAHGIYTTPPSLNAAIANQVPISRPPPPINASFIPNVPHNLEFPQLPDSGLQHPNSYQQPNFSHRPPLYRPDQINNNYNKLSNPMPQQPSSRFFTPPIGLHRPPHHRVAMHHRMKRRPPYRRNMNY